MNTEKFKKYAAKWQRAGGGQCPRCLSLHIDKAPPAETHPRLLDIGAGNDKHMKEFKEKGYRVEGIDIGAQGIKEMDMHELDFPDATFDIIFMSQVFEHAIAPILALHEFNRVLRMKGVVFMNVPADCKQWVNADEHNFCVPRENYEALFRKCGFVPTFFQEDKEAINGGDEQRMWTFMFVKVRDEGI